MQARIQQLAGIARSHDSNDLAEGNKPSLGDALARLIVVASAHRIARSQMLGRGGLKVNSGENKARQDEAS
jgi:hypothetical protein